MLFFLKHHFFGWGYDCHSKSYRGTCMAQLVEYLTLNFSSGHDLGVLGRSPALSCLLSGESAWNLSPPALPLLTLSLSNK